MARSGIREGGRFPFYRSMVSSPWRPPGCFTAPALPTPTPPCRWACGAVPARSSFSVLGGGRQGPEGCLPLGDWARLNANHAGRWVHWFPVPVKLRVSAFSENDIEGRPHRYELVRRQWIQGLVARDRHERLV